MAEENNKQVSENLGIDDVLVPPSARWADAPYASGFSLRTVIGALFIGFVMLPGLIYMGLVVGTNIGGVDVLKNADLELRAAAPVG